MPQKIKNLLAFLQGYLSAKNSRKLNREQIEAAQSKRFETFRDEVLFGSRFYSEHIDKPFSQFPVINKAIHMANFDAINTENLSRDEALDIAIKSESSRDFKPEYRGFSVGLSSGTSGSRGLFVLSEEERAEWVGYILGKMLPFSLKQQRVAFFLRANNNLYQSANGLLVNFAFFDLLNGIEANVARLDGFKPSILIAPGSVLRRIAESASAISPHRVIAVAEVLEREDEDIIERRFGVQVEQIYQCTEGFLAATCSAGNLHLNEDVCIIEKQWLQKSTGRFSPIVTDLRRKTQPIVRYLLDDVLIEDQQPCKCGSTMTRIKSIEGRCDDVLRFKSLKKPKDDYVEVFSDFIRNCIISSSDVQYYRVIQTGKDGLTIEITPCTQQIMTAVTEGLEGLWRRLSIVPPSCSFVEKQQLPIVEKQRRVIRQYRG